MKNLLKTSLVIGVGAVVLMGCAPQNITHYLPIQDVYNSPEARGKLDPSIKFYFGKSVPGKIVHTDYTNKKTNAVGKNKIKACQWAMLSAMVQMQDRAKQLGVKKISNVVSYYKKNTHKSTSEYECHAGRSIAGVALKGDFVK